MFCNINILAGANKSGMVYTQCSAKAIWATVSEAKLHESHQLRSAQPLRTPQPHAPVCGEAEAVRYQHIISTRHISRHASYSPIPNSTPSTIFFSLIIQFR